MKWLKIIILSLLITISCFFCAKQKNIVILSSYDAEDLCGKPQLEGVVDSLKSNLKDINIATLYLDSRRLSQENLNEKCEEFRKTVENKKASLIITIDDAAFNCAAKHYMGKSIPVIFSGINVTPEIYNQKFNFLNDRRPIKNFTGVYEKLFVSNQLELLEVLIGRVDKIAVLYSTDFMGETLKNQVIHELKNTKSEGKLLFFPVSSLEDLIKASDEINRRREITAYFPFVMSIKNGSIRTLKDVSPIITQKIKKPDLVVNREFMELGFLGGVSVDFYQMGYRAGELASHVLKGVKISTLQVEEAREYVKIINLKRAKELKLKIPMKKLTIFNEILL